MKTIREILSFLLICFAWASICLIVIPDVDKEPPVISNIPPSIVFYNNFDDGEEEIIEPDNFVLWIDDNIFMVDNNIVMVDKYLETFLEVNCNFEISEKTIGDFEKITGIEDVFKDSRYSLLISVGKAFDRTDVAKEITNYFYIELLENK